MRKWRVRDYVNRKQPYRKLPVGNLSRLVDCLVNGGILVGQGYINTYICNITLLVGNIRVHVIMWLRLRWMCTNIWLHMLDIMGDMSDIMGELQALHIFPHDTAMAHCDCYWKYVTSYTHMLSWWMPQSEIKTRHETSFWMWVCPTNCYACQKCTCHLL